MLSQVGQAPWPQLSELIAKSMGLHFPRERWDDLKRGFTGAAKEFGFGDTAECADWLLSTPLSKAQLQVLASHLTIGETYFFRDKQILDALAKTILPGLIRARRGRDQRLRIWSSACCTGEEPYSLAILLHQALPDLPDWRVTITATDINASFLKKAVAGIYGEWSFRDAPAGLKERYCNRTADGRFALIPEIKKMVTFAHLNLVEDVFPSLVTDTNAMDLIFCRNVLMYFTPSQVSKVIGNLHRALADGGWLAVSPSEASKALFPQFTNVNFPGAILFQKNDATARTKTSPPGPSGAEIVAQAIEGPFSGEPFGTMTAMTDDLKPNPFKEDPSAAEIPARLLASAESLYQRGRYEDAADTLTTGFADRPMEPEACSLLARALANQGRLAEALDCCVRWVAGAKLDPAAHYLRAIVLLELGDPGQARVSLRRAIYLHPGFVLAHFALGNLARSLGKAEEAEKHFANSLHLLRGHPAEEELPESDGLTAGRLAEFITSMTATEGAP